MARVTVNDRKLNSLAKQAKSWPAGKRMTISDTVVPGAVARVAAGGRISLGIIARFPLHPKNPTFHKIVDYTGAASLEPWRTEARKQLEMVQRGVDPKIEAARQRAAALRAQANTFAAVWDAFWQAHGSKLVKRREVERAGVTFLRLWGPRLAAEIEPDEIAVYIRDVARKAPEEARNRLGHLSRMYSWAIGSGGFGLKANPCAALRPTDLVGRKVARDRILDDSEIRAVWSACDSLGYPSGPLIQFMLLTGQRERECAGITWGEIDFDRTLWTLPRERMKMKCVHVVPLAPDAVTLLRSLPHFTGPHVFTTTSGQKPVNGFAKVKGRLDALTGIKKPWVLHDLRRTMRSGLSALPIEDRVREAMIAHAPPSLHKVYNLYNWIDEKRRGFELWEQRLRRILAPPPPADSVDLEAERARRVA